MANEWTRFYVVRHGETVWNHQGRWQGWQDSPLTELGHKQAAGAAEKLKDCGASGVFSSDAGRAVQTASVIGEALGLDVRQDAALRERYYGEYEGMTSAEIDEKFPGTRYEPGRDRRDTWQPIGGETLVDVSSRIMTFLRQAAELHTGESLVVVTHAGVLRVLDALASRESLEDIWHRVPGNCAIFELDGNSSGDLKIVRHFFEQ